MAPLEWPPSLYMRRPIVGVWTSTPDSLRGAWASLDEEGRVRCLTAEYGSQFGYRSLRAILIARFGPPTVDSADVLGEFSLWIDPYTAWFVGAGHGSTNRGGAILSAFVRRPGDDPRSPGFISPCSLDTS